jgi:acyl carrier protein phosphodiesterase
MNFLAHLHLSGNNPEIICGNFIGDGVKGKQALEYPQTVQQGIALHRFIDHYTDTHPVTAEARKIIRPQFRKYAGVVLDMYFDHFLGVHWPNHHDDELEDFVPHVHKVLNSFEEQMPAKTQRFFHYMKMHNWLLNYRELDALSRVFEGMASRTAFESNMENAVPVLKQHYSEMEMAFDTFFPELKKACAQFESEL